jgi:hypothetical protein
MNLVLDYHYLLWAGGKLNFGIVLQTMQSENINTPNLTLGCSSCLDITQHFTESVTHSIALVLLAEQLNGGIVSADSLYCEAIITGLRSPNFH